jgi:hypothetical protein
MLRSRVTRVAVDLFGPSWDFWDATREPIDARRTRIGLKS